MNRCRTVYDGQVVTNSHYLKLRLPSDCDRDWWDLTAGYHLGSRTLGMDIVNFGVEWIPLEGEEIELYAWVDVRAE